MLRTREVPEPVPGPKEILSSKPRLVVMLSAKTSLVLGEGLVDCRVQGGAGSGAGLGQVCLLDGLEDGSMALSSGADDGR